MKIPRIGGDWSVVGNFAFQEHGLRMIDSRALWLVCKRKTILWYEGQRRKT